VGQRTVDHTSGQDADFQGVFVAILATTLVLIVVVLATDPSLSAGFGQTIRAAWSDVVAQLARR